MNKYLNKSTKEEVTAVQFTGSEYSYRKIKKLLGDDNPFNYDKLSRVIYDDKRSYRFNTVIVLNKSGWLILGLAEFIKSYNKVEGGKAKEVKDPVEDKKEVKVKLGKEYAGCFNCKLKHLTPKLLLCRISWDSLFLSVVPGKAKYALLKLENGKLIQIGRAANISNLSKGKDFYLIERSEILNEQERE